MQYVENAFALLFLVCFGLPEGAKCLKSNGFILVCLFYGLPEGATR